MARPRFTVEPTPAPEIQGAGTVLTPQGLMEKYAAMLGTSGASTSTGYRASDADDPPVWVNIPGSKKENNQTAGVGGRTTVPASQASLEFYRMSESTRNRWGDLLVSLGLIAPSDARDFTTLRDMWADMSYEAGRFNMTGARLGPWTVVQRLAGSKEDQAKRRQRYADEEATASRKPFTGTKSVPYSRLEITNPAQAKSMVNSVLAQALGREATADELSAFTQALNSAERANPATETVTSKIVNDEMVSQSSVSTGGMDNAARGQVLLDKARKAPEYGAYQAASTYYNALIQALSSPV